MKAYVVTNGNIIKEYDGFVNKNGSFQYEDTFGTIYLNPWEYFHTAEEAGLDAIKELSEEIADANQQIQSLLTQIYK